MSLAVVGVEHEGSTVTLRAVDGIVAELGPDVTAAPGDDVLDASGLALVPGLVNGHTHAAMTLMRGYGDDMALQAWLEERIWPVEGHLTEDDVYWGTRLACAEMIRTGTVRFWDMYWHAPAVARAVRDAGLRATIATPLLDVGGWGEELKAATLDVLPSMADDPLVDVAFGPHSVYTCSPELLAWVAEESDRRALAIHVHCAETEAEVAGCLEAHGSGPVEHLDRLGLLTPRTVLAHGVWCDDEDFARIAERRATIVTNPASNLKLASGVFRYRAASDHGVSIGLGTDGAASNNALDLFAEVKLLALLQKWESRDPATLPAEEAWDVATGRLAGALGAPGRIASGQQADFLLIRADAIELTPGDLVGNLVYAASGSVVDTTVVAGRVLMQGGVVPDEADIHAEALARARRLGTASN